MIKKDNNIIEGLENIIISVYAKEMSTSDIEQELQEIYGYKLSTSAMSSSQIKLTNGY